MAAPPAPPNRLDSWKSIADYLNRDLATVRRWEKTLGLPVRRVSGNGRSVFAYPAEIDAWLNGAGGEEARTPQTVAAAAPSIATFRGWSLVAFVFFVTVAGISTIALRPRALTAADIRIRVTPEGISAFDATGRQRWQHAFPGDSRTEMLPFVDLWRLVTGANPTLYVGTSHRVRRDDSVIEGGELLAFGLDGTQKRSFSFDDRVTLGGAQYGPPWGITSFEINPAGGPEVAVAAHHFQWEPSLVTVLDEAWRRRGTFVNAGWIEGVNWLAPNRLLIAGFSNPHDGGMVALLDPAALDGQGPEAPGTHDYCDTCGTARPIRMIVMPRTELNRASSSPFNRAMVQVSTDRVIARTIEVPAEQNSADVLYEFSQSLDLLRASFSERYWEVHRALEAEGKLTHSRETCPDRDGPREIQVWEPQTGWRTQKSR